MAIYYMNVQIIGRSAGRTATGAAAYRAGERIVDERTGQAFDYTRRWGDIEAEILAPADAPAWVQDRAHLWNQVEKVEKRGDAQLCREIVVAIPLQLDREQQRELVRAYVQEQFVTRGMVADIAIHRNPGNPHAHLMLAMREMGPEGFAAKKNRDWNKPELLVQWREQWAVTANRALERAGREERIDHRSLAEQGSDRLPQVHLGQHSAALDRRGIATEKGEHNRLVEEHNAVVIDLAKAREERRQLHVEKGIRERYNARMGRGWLPVHAQAVAKLEFTLGGAELTDASTTRLADGYRREQRELATQVRAIHEEGQNLQQAEKAFERRQEVATHIERLNTPTSRMKRWFSEGARRELAQAEEGLRALNQAAESLGTTTEAKLQAQRNRWQQDQARLPGLEDKATNHERLLDLAAKALDGFAQEQERDHDWLIRPKRTRNRHSGPDR